MDIVKHIKDYKFTTEQQTFLSYLHETIESFVVIEKVKNRRFLQKYVQPRNDLFIYNYAAPGVEAERLIR